MTRALGRLRTKTSVEPSASETTTTAPAEAPAAAAPEQGALLDAFEAPAAAVRAEAPAAALAAAESLAAALAKSPAAVSPAAVSPAAVSPQSRPVRASVSTAAAEPTQQRAHELPESYGRSRVVVLPIDPYHLHAYWEVTAADAAALRARLERPGGAALAWVLRFHDVTHTPVDTASAPGHFDVEIDLDARNWYIELWAADKSYVVELGARVAGEFSAACVAKRVTVPPADLSLRGQPDWRTADPEHAMTHPVAASDPRLPAITWGPGSADAPAPETARSGLEGSAVGEQPWLRAVRGLDAEAAASMAVEEAAPSSQAPPTRASSPQALALEVPRGASAPSGATDARSSRSVSLHGVAAASGGSFGGGGDSSE